LFYSRPWWGFCRELPAVGRQIKREIPEKVKQRWTPKPSIALLPLRQRPRTKPFLSTQRNLGAGD
jgi:hypothetical protein